MAKILAASLNCVNGPDGHAVRGVRVVRVDRERDVARRDRDGRGVQQLGRRHPRPARDASPTRRCPGATRSTSSTRRTCSRTAAWNAFLKTLEEPPPHTIFVLATTEAKKVLPTVVDRCHRFDFAPPDASPRSPTVLRRVADAEAIEIPDEARRADRPLGDRLVPRRARHARAAASPTRARRSRSRTCSRCSARPTPTCCSARSTRSPPATPARRAARRGPAGRVGPRRRPLLRRPRGARCAR